MPGDHNQNKIGPSARNFREKINNLSVDPGSRLIHLTYRPSYPLLNFVDDLWLYDGYSAPHAKERIMPSGTIEMVINLRENEFRIYEAARPASFRRFSGAIVSGSYAGFFISDTVEEASLIGVHFKPGGAFPFLGLPAGELADTHVDLETLWGCFAIELRDRLCYAAAPAERFRSLEEALLKHLFCPLKHHYAVPIALRDLANTDQQLTVREVAARIGISQRRFIEVFTAETGLTPKLFGRIQRFERARTLIDTTHDLDWAVLAVDCGYYDQSHLIRDFLEFSGFSPAAYLRHREYLYAQNLHIKRNHLPLK
jgi:AraC-like DNA-binding protein